VTFQSPVNPGRFKESTHLKKQTGDSSSPFWLKSILAPLVPYITIPVGLFIGHSAWFAILGYHLAMLIILVLDRGLANFKTIWQSRGYGYPLAMLLCGAAGGILIWALWPYLNVPPGITGQLGELGLNQGNWPFFLVYFAGVNPWLEELYWRGYLGSRSRRPVINDVFFAGYHVLVLAGKIEIIWLPVIFVALKIGRASCRERVYRHV
jgi:hypothetical protein